MNVLEELRAREPLFHRPELGCTRADFEPRGVVTIAHSYSMSSSGGTRTDLIPTDGEVQDFASTELAPNTYIATYTLVQDGTRRTRRSTIWRLDGDGWKAVYHQGTLLSE